MIWSLCGIDKNETEFYKGRRQCRKCQYERHNKKYQKSEKVKEYKKGFSKCRCCKLVQTNKNNYWCSNCNPNAWISKGQLEIIKYLQKKDIEFNRQYKFKNQKGNLRYCKYDFYIPTLNTIIDLWENNILNLLNIFIEQTIII